MSRQPRALTLGSLFDGSGGFPLAGVLNGIDPVWASEIEPYPIAVTRERMPMMQHLGNVTEINGGAIRPVDIITCGSPCQDMSVAGQRAGMQHAEKGDADTTRSGLFYDAIRIIREMRESTNGEYPTYAVWENVPGAYSSRGGEDFRGVLQELIQVVAGAGVSIPKPPQGKWHSAGEIVGDGYSLAWRTLDAQYWGVPQRRKRIYLVADFGGERAGKILFERNGLSGNFESSQAAREGTAEDAARGTGGSDRVACLNPWDSQGIRQYATDCVYPINEQVATRWKALGKRTALGIGQKDDPAFTLQAVHPHMVCYALDSMPSPHSGFHEESVSITMQAGGVDPTCNQGGNVIVEPVAAFMGGQGAKAKGIGYSEDVSPTIKSVMSGGNTVPDVVYQNTGIGWWNAAHVAETLRTPCGGDATKANHVVFALQGNGIDRAETAGCNGKGWRENECYTLNTIDRPGVVYDARGNGDGETVPTLTGDHQNRVTDYISVSCMAHGQSNAEITQDISHTLNCNHEQPIVYMLDDQGGSRISAADNDLSPTLRAQMHQHEPIVTYAVDCRHAVLDGKPPRRYSVRRLTPLECCRLQGFPDGWGEIGKMETMTAAEAEFWERVRATHAKIMGKKYTRAKDAAALVRWYNKLHTDTAEYKMWGNGIALPCAAFVLAGIAREAHEYGQDGS